MQRKKLEILALIIFIVLFVVLLSFTRRDDSFNKLSPESGIQSSYKTYPAGYKALFETLSQLNIPTHRQLQPYALLPARGLLISSNPEDPGITPYECKKLQAWLAEGNYALISLNASSAALLASLGSNKPSTPRKSPTKKPLETGWASEFKHPVDGASLIATQVSSTSFPVVLPPLTVQSPNRFPENNFLPDNLRRYFQTWQPLCRDSEGVSVLYSPVGHGGVIWCASPWSFSNDGISQGKNIDFILALTKLRPGTAVIFDEYHHGYGANMGVWSLLPTLTKIGVIQLSLALLLFFLVVAWRFGPPRLPAEERYSRSRAEYLISMAELLLRVRATHVVRDRLALYLRRELMRQLGVPYQADAAQFLQANALHPMVEQSELEGVFKQLRLLQSVERPEQETVFRLVKAIHHLLRKPKKV